MTGREYPDLTVVVTAHREGRMAHHTMRSLFRAMAYGNERGMSFKVVVVLDRADDPTREYFLKCNHRDVTIRTADCGDLGLSRNFGVGFAEGRYVGVLDADNLICRNWLFDAARYLDSLGREAVAHPEYQMVFEARNFVFRQISSLDPDFTIGNIIEYNYWDAVCVARRETFTRHPYEATTQSEGFGFEDWHWNCQTLADGIEHHVVPGTVHFLRMKRQGSLLTHTRASKRVIRPSKLFEPELFSVLVQGETSDPQG